MELIQYTKPDKANAIKWIVNNDKNSQFSKYAPLILGKGVGLKCVNFIQWQQKKEAR